MFSLHPKMPSMMLSKTSFTQEPNNLKLLVRNQSNSVVCRLVSPRPRRDSFGSCGPQGSRNGIFGEGGHRGPITYLNKSSQDTSCKGRYTCESVRRFEGLGLGFLKSGCAECTRPVGKGASGFCGALTDAHLSYSLNSLKGGYMGDLYRGPLCGLLRGIPGV